MEEYPYPAMEAIPRSRTAPHAESILPRRQPPRRADRTPRVLRQRRQWCSNRSPPPVPKVAAFRDWVMKEAAPGTEAHERAV